MADTDNSSQSGFLDFLGNQTGSTGISDLLKGAKDLFSGQGDFGKPGQLAAFGGLAAILNRMFQQKPDPVGYQYGVPRYTVTRSQTPIAQQRPVTRTPQGREIPYRPGQGGITYFTPTQYSYAGFEPAKAEDFIRSLNPPAPEPVAPPVAAPAPAAPTTTPASAVTTTPAVSDGRMFAGGSPNFDERTGLYTDDRAVFNPSIGPYMGTPISAEPTMRTPTLVDDRIFAGGSPNFNERTDRYMSGEPYFFDDRAFFRGTPLIGSDSSQFTSITPARTGRRRRRDMNFASGGQMEGGIAMLAGGRYLRGPGDGVSDSIPARFAQSGQPARLADGEFVIDARTVSEIGNGSSEAGARKLYAMMDRVHAARKKAARGKPSGADKELRKLVKD